jgi:hypothetical protein
VLADQVGLGNTLQLAMAAQLMALLGEKPVLVLVPKALLGQWQDELITLLDMPSSVWDGRQWVDHHGIEHPSTGPESIRTCPTRVGIVSTGLITRRSEAAGWLAELMFECVIVDEAHRARRKNLRPGEEFEVADPNNLLEFLYRLSPRTKSLLLATATPVQLHPIEVWDLMDALGRGSQAVLGGYGSLWRRPRTALPLVMGNEPLPDDPIAQWEWFRNPVPPASEGIDYRILRQALRVPDSEAVVPGSHFERLRPPDRASCNGSFLIS